MRQQHLIILLIIIILICTFGCSQIAEADSFNQENFMPTDLVFSSILIGGLVAASQNTDSFFREDPVVEPYVAANTSTLDSKTQQEPIHDDGSSPASPPKTITIPATSDTGSYRISWSQGDSATSYQLQESSSSGFSITTTIYSGSDLSYSLTGKLNGTYYYRIRSKNSKGYSSWATGNNSCVVNIESSTPDPAPESPVTLTIPSSSNSGSYVISWSASTYATEYQLQESTISTFTTGTDVYSGSSASYQITGKSDGTYYYRVRAKNSTGNSPWKGGSNPCTVAIIVRMFTDYRLDQVVRSSAGYTGPTYPDAISPDDVDDISFLNASDQGISSLSGLENCTSLQIIYMDQNSITDLSPISNLTNLVEIQMGKNSISDLSPLRNLTSLQVIGMDRNNISNISVLRYLTNLGSICFHGNSVSDITPIQNLPLYHLGMGENNNPSIAPLQYLTGLQSLGLNGNNISDISPLQNLVNMREITMGGNNISDISPLHNMTGLTMLGLEHNPVSDISILENLTSLQNLYLLNNQVTNILPLVNNAGIGSGDTIILSFNTLDDISENTYIPQLRSRGVDVTY